MLKTIKQECEEYGCCTISEGTLRAQDLLPKMVDTLLELKPDDMMTKLLSDGLKVKYNDPKFWDKEALKVIGILDESLNDAAPEGFYFGTHRGDGACLGFWKAEPEDEF